MLLLLWYGKKEKFFFEFSRGVNIFLDGVMCYSKRRMCGNVHVDLSVTSVALVVELAGGIVPIVCGKSVVSKRLVNSNSPEYVPFGGDICRSVGYRNKKHFDTIGPKNRRGR